ncbi:putative UHRF1-binding protein [Helianthus annuus]|nr:putative UHRF1-binding protein [Helianthus annuus]
MESIMARALEYTLKYWFKSFTRDQFKLQGRTVQLSNLDINGDALHASLGLPPALTVSMAKSGKLEIVLPYLSNVQIMPIVVQIDKLDLVLEENDDVDSRRSTSSAQAPSNSSKSSGYGFAEKIADGMTLQIQTVNLLLETHGGGRHLRGVTWASPMASITIRNLVLYTTNENWQVVNLKAAREFSCDKNFIYVFRKLEWEHLCIDLLPHPDMLSDDSEGASNRKDDDGAKRVFFGGERFIDGVSGEAYITIQRTDLNCPLGLEVQVHISETICPALSEPGLRALLRFFMGLYVCLNRDDVNPTAQEQSAEAAGHTLVSFMVDHIFLGIKDSGFQLEFLMQSLFFSRASVSDGEIGKCLTQFMVGGLILRDTFSRPPCPLVQPSMQNAAEEILQVPDFGKNFCPPIYPLGDQQCRQNNPSSLLSIHSLLYMPSLSPPSFSSQTVIDCKPLTIHLQEESCLRILSLLVDGIVVNPDDIASDPSISSLHLNIKELNITVPLEATKPDHFTYHDNSKYNLFKGARLRIENLYLSESPSMKLGLLNLDMDAACFCMWEGQPIDSSMRKWTAGASVIGLSLDTCNNPIGGCNSQLNSSEPWRCVELQGVCVQAAMVTSDGSPLRNIPPPGGIVRVGVACEQLVSNTSIEQLFYVLDFYTFIDNVSGKMAMTGKDKWSEMVKKESSDYKSFSQKGPAGPADTAISLASKNMKLKFLEPSSIDTQGTPLVQFIGDNLLLQVSHRTLGAAMAISSTLRWDKVQVDCAANGTVSPGSETRAVFWVQNKTDFRSRNNTDLIPFLNLSAVHVIPYDAQDRNWHSLRVSGCIAGVRLAGGMNHTEALLHRVGVLGPDGRPGAGLSKGLDRLSTGPLSKLFKASPPYASEVRESQNESIGGENSSYVNLGAPEDVNVSLELNDWLFALESMEVMSERLIFNDLEDSQRKERSWHTCFESIKVQANGSKNDTEAHKYPVELVKVRVDSWKTVKPQQKGNTLAKVEPHDGMDLEFDLALSQDNDVNRTISCALEHLKISSKQPIEVVVSKEEIQHVSELCKMEINSFGRIAVGILQLLKLDGSVGQTALNRLSNLGSDGVEKIFSPGKQITDAKPPSFDHGQTSDSPPDNQCSSSSLDSTLSSLNAELLDSQSDCATLCAELSTSDSSNTRVQQLAQRLESMQRLLTRLRTQV